MNTLTGGVAAALLMLATATSIATAYDPQANLERLATRSGSQLCDELARELDLSHDAGLLSKRETIRLKAKCRRMFDTPSTSHPI